MKNVKFEIKHLNPAILLTIALTLLKLCGVISWSWWIVFLPLILSFICYGLIIFVICIVIFFLVLIENAEIDENDNKKE